MTDITQAQFEAGVGFTNGEILNVTMDNGTTYQAIWDGVPYDVLLDDIQYAPISIQKFRERFDIFTRAKLDRLENNMEVDAVVLELCVNLTPETIEPYRSFLRTVIKTMYHAEDDLVYIDAQVTKDGMDLLLQVGLIDAVTHTHILDTSTLL